MPRLHPGTEPYDLSPTLQDWYDRVEPVKRLLNIRVLNTPKGVQTFRGHHLDSYDSMEWVENHAEATEPKHNVADGMYFLRLVRTLPAAGKPLQQTKGITVVMRWVWVPNDDDGDGIPNAQDTYDNNSYSYSGGDDDFNVPAWLCPTRFC